MPIHRLLENSPFGADEVACMVTAYEDALGVIGPIGLSDVVKEIVAKKIIDIAQRGERDPVQMRRYALKGIGIPLAK